MRISGTVRPMLIPLHANLQLAGNLVALRISNGAIAGETLPGRLKLLKWGVNETVKGPVTVGPETVRQLSANQAKRGYDRVAIDYNHQTVPGSEEHDRIVKQRGSIDPLPVAGYGTPVVIPNDGLYLENIEWTPSGLDSARNYSDLSPTPQLNDKGEVVFLHSVALCRQGAVNGLTFFNSSFLKSLTTPSMDNPTTTSSAINFRDLFVTLLKKLGLTVPDGASDSDIAGLVDQFKAPEVKKDEKVEPMSVEARLAKLETDRAEEAKTNLVLVASSQGKVIPLTPEAIKVIPLAILKELVDKLPAGTVPLVAGQRPAASTQVTTLTAEEKETCRLLHIDEAKFLKDKQADPAAVRPTTV